MPSQTLIGRHRERAELTRCLNSAQSEFVAIYGRRRVGKTFLVRRFFHDTFTFYASGAAEGKMRDELDVFHEALQTYGGPDIPRPSTWLQAFRSLRDIVERSSGPGKRVIFLDELPWFDTPRSRFLTAFEHFWNTYASARDDVILVACGSATSWMIERLLKNRGGLYNRVTARIRLDPFTVGECDALLQDAGVVLNRRQVVEAHMAVGGVPYYLRLFDRRLGVTQNIDRLCFGRDALLRDEYDMLFDSLFRRGGHHRTIVETLATNSSGLSREELVEASGLANGGTLTKTLDELEQNGFISATVPFGAKRKGALYRVSDPFVLFSRAFMGEQRDEQFWSRLTPTPRHAAWAGLAFEQVCLSHIPAVKRALGISAVATRESGWRARRRDGTPGAQIDLVIDRDDGVVNLCEMKFTASEFTITKSYADALRRRRELFRETTGTKSALHLTMITPYGLVRNEYADTVQQDLTIDDVFGDRRDE